MILVTGAGGQVGRELLRLAVTPAVRPAAATVAGIAVPGPTGALPAGAAVADGQALTVVGLARAALDITDAAAVAAALREHGARLVINAAAWTDVDGAERAPAAAFAANRDGPGVLAAACAAAAIPLLHLSTDHVFDGRRGRPWREDDELSPLGVYGRSKAAGEAAIRARLPAHVILRTSWVFGAQGRNFVKTLLARARAGEALAMVGDQVGGPTPAAALAAALLALAARHLAGAGLPWGTYHLAGRPCLSRHAFAQAVLAAAQARGLLATVPPLQEITAAAWPGASLRPANACLDCTRAERRLGLVAPDWRAGLAAVLDELAVPER